MSRPDFPVIVAQYDLQGHPRRTEHWNLVLLASRSSTHSFEVRGNMDTFTYVVDLDANFTLANISTYRGGCHIGNIPADYVQTMQEKLGQIPVVRLNPNWDCQDWVLQAILILQEAGFAFPHVDEKYVRNELAEDMERWQKADDTIDERLLAIMGPGRSA